MEFFQNHIPVIGISGASSDNSSVRAMMTQIASSGAIPMFLGNHERRDPAKDVEKIDALVIMGNDMDLDPNNYNQTRHKKTKSEFDRPENQNRAYYEYMIMGKALDIKMPLLTICGGTQRLNVMLGGDLQQHIPDTTGHDDHNQQLHNIAPFIPVHPVQIKRGSSLADIADSSLLSMFIPTHKNLVYDENSIHHQAMGKIGEGLKESAYSKENGSKVIEAVEADPKGKLKGQFVIGVQWHPEFSASELGAKIANRLREKALKFAKDNNRKHSMAEVRRENILSSLNKVFPNNLATIKKGSMAEAILAERMRQPHMDNGQSLR
ncbi:MAG: gamma-glutamyl-gamma-aminobutyrate hydrolase family protein [Rickettsiales bacterium]